MVEQARRQPIKRKNPDVLDIALQFVEGRGCVIHVRDSSRRSLESKQLGIGKLKVLVTPRERDRYSITVGVEMSIRAKRYRVTGMRNAEVVAAGLCMCWVGTTGKLTNSGRHQSVEFGMDLFYHEGRLRSLWTPSRNEHGRGNRWPRMEASMDGAITTSGAATPRELSTGLSRENGRRQRMVVGRMKTHTLNVDAGAEPRGWMSPDHA